MSDNPNPSDLNYEDWTDAEIDDMANVNAATLADAQTDARDTDPDLAGLLDATEE